MYFVIKNTLHSPWGRVYNNGRNLGESMFKIGDFSKIARVTIKTLRYYDKIGLLKPSFIDIHTGYRYYTDEQISEIHAILSYKKAGLSNADVKNLLSKKCKQKEILLSCKEKLQMEIESLSRQIDSIDKLLCEENKDEYSVTVKTVNACKVCYFCGYVENNEQIPTFIHNCHAEIRATNPEVRFPIPDYCCIIYPHDEYRESNIFVQYAQSVVDYGKETEILKFKELEEVVAISVVHHGNYETLSNAYLYAVKWAKENGYVLRGDARERYIHGAWDNRVESEWETEVQLPILIKEER